VITNPSVITLKWGQIKWARSSRHNRPGVSASGAKSDRHSEAETSSWWSHFKPSRWGQLRLSRPAETVVPRLREIIDRNGELRVLVLIESEFSKEPSALWEGIKADAEFGIGHRKAWRRIAYVTDRDWIRAAVNLTSWLIPGEVKVFPPDKPDEAEAWVAGES
jgi:SpoIIAA-like